MSAHSPRNSITARLAALMVAACLGAASAQACQLETNLPALDLVIDYDVYAFQRAAAGNTFRIENTGETECRLLITAETEATLPPPFTLPGAGISAKVSLPDTEGSLGEGTDPLHAGQTILILAPGMERTETLDLFVDDFISVPAGNYTADFRFTVKDLGSANPDASVDASVSLVAAPRAQVNIAGTTGNFGSATFSESVHFDNPKPDDVRQVFIQTRSNALTTLTLSTEHGGRMKRDDLSDSWISYTATLDGAPVDLANGTTISGRAATDLNGVSLPFEMKIETLNKVFAGDYEDTVYVDITAY